MTVVVIVAGILALVTLVALYLAHRAPITELDERLAAADAAAPDHHRPARRQDAA